MSEGSGIDCVKASDGKLGIALWNRGQWWGILVLSRGVVVRLTVTDDELQPDEVKSNGGSD